MLFLVLICFGGSWPWFCFLRFASKLVGCVVDLFSVGLLLICCFAFILFYLIVWYLDLVLVCLLIALFVLF